jgi:cobalt/nickel transport system permease protein
VLNGLAGLLLGWAVFPAMAIALLLQAVLFGFGGLTTLGVNTATMALPGVVCYYLFCRGIRTLGTPWAAVMGFGAGSLAILLSSALLGVALITTGKAFWTVFSVVAVGHVPVLVIEGLITAFIVLFLRRVRPEILSPYPEA